MSHEPECDDECGSPAGCICDELRRAYRRGYNDHARSRAYAEQVYGPYVKRLDEGIVTVEQAREWNQHGKGENP